MSQLAGWRFLELGRRIERALATCRFMRQFAFADRSGWCARRVAGARRQPDHLSAALCHGGGARAGDRSRGARSQQSALRSSSSLRASRPILPRCRSAATKAGLSPPEQIATALTARMRTADAAARRPRQRCSTSEAALMKLSDVVASTYFTTHARSEAAWECARMIYDVRQETTLPLCVAGRLCAPRAAARPDRPSRPAGAGGRARCQSRRRSSAAKGRISSATGPPGSRSTSRMTR